MLKLLSTLKTSSLSSLLFATHIAFRSQVTAASEALPTIIAYHELRMYISSNLQCNNLKVLQRRPIEQS